MYKLKMQDVKYSNYKIPINYRIKENSLYYVNEREIRPGEYKRIEEKVCSQIPYIVGSFIDVENNNYYYVLSWVYGGIEHQEIIQASYLATKRELVTLSNKSLAVTDNNARDLIKYFELYKEINDIPRSFLTKKIGRIKVGFIHPLENNNTLIMPLNDSEKQLLNSFQCKGEVSDWIENVFSPIKQHPKALIMVISSFASILLSDLKVDPFIVDLSGETSNGKTTLLKVCASIWGTSDLIGEWNITKVSLERKAVFLNSFPLLLDDTRKANDKEIKDYIYSFSGGREKGRGSIVGGRSENTWGNILLSTGEIPLNDYVDNMAGAAARIISLNGLPFGKVQSNFFLNLHTALNEYYGTVGLEFTKYWETEKNKLDISSEFNIEVRQFQERTLGNQVIFRIARNFAVLFYTAKLLNRFFKLEIDLKSIINIFDQMVVENKSLDKPKEQLEMILQKLDANRKSIYYDTKPNEKINAIYTKNTLWLTPSFLRETFGAEHLQIRRSWLSRGFIISRISKNKIVDYFQLNINRENYQGIGLKKEILSELEFDFSN